MAITGENESGEDHPIFGLWLSQWRLAILDCESAKSLLVSIVKLMPATQAQQVFWAELQHFFKAISEAREPGNDHDRWVELTNRLTPHEAKRLLEHLSRGSSLNEDFVFWRTVKKAIHQCNPETDSGNTQLHPMNH